MAEFEVLISKADFKFNCAHFIIFDGFRERLHGHNYQLSVRVTGHQYVGSDGYLIDFGDIKKAARSLCKDLNEYFICPTRSTNMKIVEDNAEVCLECDDGSRFVFPRGDCAMLPLYHSSAEELAHYFWCAIIR
jgi:dihydroneopterin triphosphate aldolase (PTPS-III) / 6-pyruvoyltetrahydropterin synthase